MIVAGPEGFRKNQYRKFNIRGEDLTPGESEPEETEDLRLWKLPLAQAVALCMSDRITDAISVAGLLKAEKVLAARGVGTK